MTEDNARYDNEPRDRSPRDPEPIGAILRRLAEQNGWDRHLPDHALPTRPGRVNGHRRG